MNKTKLESMRGFRVRLRPLAMKRMDRNRRPEPWDEVWITERGPKDGLSLRDSNSLGYCIHLPSNYVHDFRRSCIDPSFPEDKQGIFVLLGFLLIEQTGAQFEPLSLPTAENLFLRQLGI